MRPSILAAAAAAGIVSSAFLTAIQPRALAHCEVPCGIYDDHARIDLMLEDMTTIEKATGQIIALSGKTDALSVNQTVRWVATKDEHATRIQVTIAQYFLTQRIKPKAPGSAEWNDYVTRLAEHHAVMIAAMKTKQTVDPGSVTALRMAINRIAKYYPQAPHSHG